MNKSMIFMLALVLGLAGCTNNYSAGVSVEGQTQSVFYGDEYLGAQFDVKNIRTLDRHGHARGVVELTNTSDFNQSIQYRFYWYDQQGLEVNTKQAPWKRQIFRGGETLTLSEVSISPEGKEFRMQLREAKD
ncbi:YcfL family protein [Vibrio hippocampi]|uniref:DUF1425 domain-containing protein n=1 Tax=Vibrio hippocampi TaxID=654686 RepID=A0ABN8DEQ1_9VIBR|nr:YcfL family protein [Vibrio hippocampi]CAH0525551.1 hypothetical protein VHP8226_01078 [Vibrio hippocampi]